MPYEVPPLPYDYAALEPHIDEQTMRLHHDKHHQAYVDKANAALAGTEWADRPVDEVLRNLGELPEDKRTVVRNNGGGHYNHTLFWEIMGRLFRVISVWRKRLATANRLFSMTFARAERKVIYNLRRRF